MEKWIAHQCDLIIFLKIVGSDHNAGRTNNKYKVSVFPKYKNLPKYYSQFDFQFMWYYLTWYNIYKIENFKAYGLKRTLNTCVNINNFIKTNLF